MNHEAFGKGKTKQEGIRSCKDLAVYQVREVCFCKQVALIFFWSWCVPKSSACFFVFNKVSMALLANYVELNNTAILVVSSSEVLVFPELTHRGVCFILEN